MPPDIIWTILKRHTYHIPSLKKEAVTSLSFCFFFLITWISLPSFLSFQIDYKDLLSSFACSGSGKTYTMQPLPIKASQDIIRLMHHTYRNQGFQLYVSFFEIYGGKLFDLLNDRR